METETRSTLLSFCLIVFGLVIIGLVLVKFMDAPSIPKQDNHQAGAKLPANWFTERSLGLLEMSLEEVAGINLALAARQSPFKRPAPAAPVVEEPPPAPVEVAEVVPPPPPPKQTRKIELLYSGLYTTAQGQLRVYLNIDGQLRILAVGQEVAGEWLVENATSRELVLRKEGGDEVFLSFNAKKMLEVPIE